MFTTSPARCPTLALLPCPAGELQIVTQYGSSPTLAADINGDGNLNFFDVSAFLTAFNAGCP